MTIPSSKSEYRHADTHFLREQSYQRRNMEWDRRIKPEPSTLELIAVLALWVCVIAMCWCFLGQYFVAGR